MGNPVQTPPGCGGFPMVKRSRQRTVLWLKKGAEMAKHDQDWTKPAAKAIPKEGYFELERGRYGPVFPRTPACYGFSIIAKVKEGREEAIRAYGKTIEETIAGSPEVARAAAAALPALGALRHRRPA